MLCVVKLETSWAGGVLAGSLSSWTCSRYWMPWIMVGMFSFWWCFLGHGKMKNLPKWRVWLPPPVLFLCCCSSCITAQKAWGRNDILCVWPVGSGKEWEKRKRGTGTEEAVWLSLVFWEHPGKELSGDLRMPFSPRIQNVCAQLGNDWASFLDCVSPTASAEIRSLLGLASHAWVWGATHPTTKGAFVGLSFGLFVLSRVASCWVIEGQEHDDKFLCPPESLVKWTHLHLPIGPLLPPATLFK